MRATRLRPLLLLLMCLPGCHTWARQDLAPGAAPAARPIHGRVRATRTDGSRVELASARLAGDTLRGELYEIPRGRGPAAVAVPLDSLRRLEARRFSGARTGALVAGVVLGPMALFTLAVIASGGPGFSP